VVAKHAYKPKNIKVFIIHVASFIGNLAVLAGFLMALIQIAQLKKVLHVFAD